MKSSVGIIVIQSRENDLFSYSHDTAFPGTLVNINETAKTGSGKNIC